MGAPWVEAVRGCCGRWYIGFSRRELIGFATADSFTEQSNGRAGKGATARAALASWLALRYAAEAVRELGHVALWYPQYALVGVAVWVGKYAISIYAGYLGEILSLMEQGDGAIAGMCARSADERG